MSEPSVCCVCLTADRQAFTDRAVRSFLAQDYPNKTLLIEDTGVVRYELPKSLRDNSVFVTYTDRRGAFYPIGKLRNMALWTVSHMPPRLREEDPAQIICHWDDDDWSAPTRISEQVRLLQESGKQAVGYNEMLFWDSRRGGPNWTDHLGISGVAWLYHNSDPRYIIDTSLCFWRSVWEAKRFPECHIGEGREWIKGLDTQSIGSFRQVEIIPGPPVRDAKGVLWETNSAGALFDPAMVAEIHGGNTTIQVMDPRDLNTDGIPYWRRAPEWDARVRESLEGA